MVAWVLLAKTGVGVGLSIPLSQLFTQRVASALMAFQAYSAPAPGLRKHASCFGISPQFPTFSPANTHTHTQTHTQCVNRLCAFTVCFQRWLAIFPEGRKLICIYTRVFLYMHICTDLHMHIYLYVSLYKYAPSMHMFIHIQHVYYIPLYTDMYLYMHILIHILHGYKYTATYMQMPICVYMSVYMYSLSL